MIEIMVHVDIPAVEKLAGAIMAMGTKSETTTEITPQALRASPPLAEGLAKRSGGLSTGDGEDNPPQPAAPAAPPSGGRSKEDAAEAAWVTLDQVQRAAAFLRDQGKLKAVTEMFGEFGIRKLSDLEGDKLQAFAGRLRGLGAEL